VKPRAFHPDALAEFQAQAIYYEERSAGLGVRFAEQVEAAIRLAESMPIIRDLTHAWQARVGGMKVSDAQRLKVQGLGGALGREPVQFLRGYPEYAAWRGIPAQASTAR
jgi:hypothetical protein